MSKPSYRPEETAKRIVTHVTEVKISLAASDDGWRAAAAAGGSIDPAAIAAAGERIASHHARVASMMLFLAGHGFLFRAGKNAVHGYSSEIEAGDAKRLLIAAGFEDREFQIVLEYTRGWGML
jgi:hypothetical protein